MTADHAFIQTGADGRYCLPGASLRGVLRHQAARIATTLGLKEAVGELFGEVQGKSARRGLIEIGSGTLVGKPRPVYLDHVAIDRITGFAADKKKFATCGLQSPSFETFVRLRFREQHLHLVALAGFVLRDLFDGMLWCGGGTSRGYGFITGVSVRKTVLDLTPPLRQASGDSNPTAEEAPDDFLAEVHRAVTPGRTRWEIAGDTIPFDSWFWQRAEAAWTDALAQAAGGAR